MSERMKKHLIEEPLISVRISGSSEKVFLLPAAAQRQLITFLKSLNPEGKELIPADEVFKEVYQKYGKVGATLRDYRHRSKMTQTQLAEKLGIEQSHISQMEYSKRPIGKKMAQKLAKIFNTSYRLFL